jgi:pyridoxamine 5'-phosphate oxidase
MPGDDPIRQLERWIEEARAEAIPQPASVAFVTVGALAEELFAERDPGHQLQTVVSRQGEPIDDLDALRDRLAHLARVQEAAPACPEDWGALRVRPETIELWSEARDRLHERRLFERSGDGWKLTLLAP